MASDLLLIDKVTKVFDKTRAVDGISLVVPSQSVFGLLGPNGAGKTTLIRMITNILYQDSGTITLQGVPPNMTRNMFIGYMPEERGLYKKMKVGEQLMYLAQLKNLSKTEAKKKLMYWLEKFGIADWWDKRVAALSKGMQQKIQFIATVVHEPKLIILDEPFSGLDPINTNLIKDEILYLKNKGATILFSTHRMGQIEELCEKIALINQGKIVLEGTVKELKNRFKQHQFELHFEGNLANVATSHFKVLSQQPNQAVIRLEDDYTANEVLLHFIHSGLLIRGFKEILPSLNDIFISQVETKES